MSANLNITQWAEGQSHPEVTVNDGIAALDAALTEAFAVDLTAGNVSITSAQYRGAIHFLASGASVGGRTVTVPAVKRLVVVSSASTNSASISVVRGVTTFPVLPGEKALVITDGTANGLTVTILNPEPGDYVPAGGDTGDVLAKQSSADGDFDWTLLTDIIDAPPAGGNTDDVLTKLSNADADYDWRPGGIGGVSSGIFPAPPPDLDRPQITDFGTWLNQGMSIARDLDYGFVLRQPGRGTTDSLSMRYRNVPAGDHYAVTLGITANQGYKANVACGIALHETASDNLLLLGMGLPNNSGTSSESWGSPTGTRSTKRGTGDQARTAFLRLVRGGNMIQPFLSYDGYNFAVWDDPWQILSEFTVAPDHWGPWVNANNTGGVPNLDCSAFIWHWEVLTTDNLWDYAAYVNKHGSGNRLATITTTTNATITNLITELVDGDYLSNTNKPFFTADASGNRHITFQFSASVTITEAKFFMNTPSSQGTWKWQGSPDGAAWTDLNGGATFTLTGSSSGTILGDLTSNNTAWLYYRMQQTAGALTNTPFLRQIDFKVLN